MRKIATIVTVIICIFLFYLTFESTVKVFSADWQLPRATEHEQMKYRIVLITQELETPFWDQVSAGAIEQAQKSGVELEVWGSYGNNQEDFLKKIEIAIYSKVDGIIVQGLDTDEFKDLTKIKAASYGIPIITVANDVPMEESLRRTYVGSNQYRAGELIANELLADMGETGEVVLLFDSRQEYYQRQRLDGIKDVLKDYPNIQTIDAETQDTREQVTATTKQILNQIPELDAFIAINANFAGDMIQEIGSRSQIDPYHIYSFDDDPESLSLLEEGKLDGMIEQSPRMMGETSVNLMNNWLRNDHVPLDMDGYLTDIRMVKAMDVQ
ncbi:sugar ABC transporter substrate-binding protein [Radiobacillus sp. PE A8.2]|uniref:sugar ABC transporter substrate-binding protein n=1 Tax=Radiobacillus sp. PE A8.2 TaxID=3380349 RepID=UPI00388E955C